MQSNIQQAYLIRDEKNAGANTAARVGTLLAALCADVAQHDTGIAELGGIIGTVDISDGMSALDAVQGSGRAGIYRLDMAGVTAGWMAVSGDGMVSMTCQTVAGCFAASGKTLSPGGADALPSVFTRKFRNDAEAGQDMGWTAWRDLGAGQQGQAGQTYPAVAEWSGRTVSGPALEERSYTGDGGEVVLDTVRGTFLLYVGPGAGEIGTHSYYASWSGWRGYLSHPWTQGGGGGGFLANTAYAAADGSLWIATSSTAIKRVTGTDTVDADLSATSRNAVENRAVTAAITKTNEWNEA